MDRTLIVFDMDTHCLAQNDRHADIRRILKRHGFTNIQGTVYLSEAGVKQAHGTLALQEVAARFEWFYSCARNIQFYKLKDDFNAQFIVDNVQAARLLFRKRMEEMKSEMLKAGFDAEKVNEIIDKRQFSLEEMQDYLLEK